MRNEVGDEARLSHIFECIEEIESALVGHNYETFIADHVIRIAVVKWLEIIGEASNHITAETKIKYKNVDWIAIVDFRNFVVHEYFGINYNVIWQIASVLLKDLKKNLTQ